MAKAPTPGTVKTRLRLDPQDAARLQEALIQDAVAKAKTLAPTTVAGTPVDCLNLIRPLLPEGVPLIPQSEGDLGDRMLAASQYLFDDSDDPVVILGTDAPTLRPGAIEAAANVLASKHISIIPSADGGYVLLGVRRPEEVLFSGIEWSTDAVYRQTLRRADEAGLSVWEGRLWYDVDEPGDLARLRRELEGAPRSAPRTAAVLRRL